MPLPQPEGDQVKVLCLSEKGHFVVLGTAGSGKTTLAIHRAAYLAKRTKTNHKVLLVTFNKSFNGSISQFLFPETFANFFISRCVFAGITATKNGSIFPFKTKV